MHVLGEPMQVKPKPTLHVKSQPSPGSMFPSSQASLPTITPSPQSVMHALGLPLHTQPGSVAHAASQPSPGSMLPGSACS